MIWLNFTVRAVYNEYMHLLIRLMADGLVIVVLIIALYMFLAKIPRRQWKWWYPRIFLAGVTAYAIKFVIAHLIPIEQMRPFERLGVKPDAAYLQNGGFPSDHALFMMFLTLAVWYSTKNKWVTIVMLVLSVLMGIGRVLALVHTPVDIIGGFAVAFVGIGWYYIGRDKLDSKAKR